MPSLEHYLADALKRSITKHRLVASVTPDGLVGFFVHPLDITGPTARFVTYDAAVVPRDGGTPPALARSQPAPQAVSPKAA